MAVLHVRAHRAVCAALADGARVVEFLPAAQARRGGGMLVSQTIGDSHEANLAASSHRAGIAVAES